MLGPYIAGQLPNQSLEYEARLAYGKSLNRISPTGTYTDKFRTERWFASGKLSGHYVIDDLRISPEFKISWFEERQNKYVDSLIQIIPEQTISFGEIRFGPRIQRIFMSRNGVKVKSEMSLSGIQKFNINSSVTDSVKSFDGDKLRGRLEIGFEAIDRLRHHMSSMSS